MMKQKLTVRSINEIKVREHDVIVWDTEITGFAMKVTPRGKRSFFLYYRTVDHIQRRPLIGYYPAIKPETAREMARTMIAQVRAGGDPSLERKRTRAGRGEGTVAQMVNQYIVAKGKLRTIREIERIFRRDILPEIGEMNVENVRRSDVTHLLEKIEKRAPIVARNARAHLSSFYNWVLPRLSDTAVNPVIGSVRISASPVGERVLSDDEISLLWDVIESEPIKWQIALKLLILTGQRRNEVLQADWSEFNLNKAEWVIPAERSKNKKAHIVPLSPEVIQLLETIPQRNGRLFPKMSKVARVAKRIRAKMEDQADQSIEHWVWHDIRRTVATGLQKIGTRREVIEAILNHVSGSRSGIVRVYQKHDWAHQKRQALELWSQQVFRMTSK